MPPKKHTRRTYIKAPILLRNEDEMEKEPLASIQHRPVQLTAAMMPSTILLNMTILGESRIDVALPQIQMIVVNEFGPVVSVLGYGYLEPWFQVAIVMYDSTSFDVLLADIWVVAKTEDMPRPVKGISAIPKRD